MRITPRLKAPTLAVTVALAVVSIVAGVLAAIPVGTAGAQPSGTSTDRPITTSIPVPDPVSTDRIVMVDQTTFVAPGDQFTVVIETPDATATDTLTLELYPPVTSRIQFGRTLGGEDLGTPVQRQEGIVIADLPTVTPGQHRITLTIPVAGEPDNPFALQATSAGVWPLVLQRGDDNDDDNDDARLITHVVRLEASDQIAGEAPSVTQPPLSVGVMVDVAAPVLVATDGTSGIDDADVLGITETAQMLIDSPVPFTLAPRPQTLEALATAGPQGQAAVTALSQAAVDAEVLDSSWVPVDTASLVAGGMTTFLQRQLDAGTATIERLLGVRPNRGTAIVDTTVDPLGLDALVGLGVRQVVIPEGITEPLDSAQFPVTLTRSFDVLTASNSDVPALQSDEVTSGLLQSSPQPALAANRVLADLAVLAFDLPDPQRAVVINADASTTDAGALQAVLAGLEQAGQPSPTAVPLLGSGDISAVFNVAAPATDPSTGEQLVRSWQFGEPVPLGEFSQQLADVDARAEALSATLQPGPNAPEATATVAAVEHLILTSGLATLEASGRTGYLIDADEAVTTALAPLGVPEQGTITLTSDSAVVPVTLVNGRADPVLVRVQLASDKLEFPDGSDFAVELQPGTNRTEVTVRTRASGAFPVQLELRTANDEIVLGTARFTVRSTAFSGVGLALSMLAGVFLALWWGMHFRSARRSRQLMPVDSSSTDVAGH